MFKHVCVCSYVRKYNAYVCMCSVFVFGHVHVNYLCVYVLYVCVVCVLHVHMPACIIFIVALSWLPLSLSLDL